MTSVPNPLPGSVGTVTVTPAAWRDCPGILVELVYDKHSKSIHLVEDGDGMPIIVEGKLGWRPAVAGSHNIDRPLTRFLSGRWGPMAAQLGSRYDDTLPPYRPDVAGITEWARGIRPLVREAIPAAGFSPAFADALDAISRWSCGPGHCDVKEMFGAGHASQALRDFVRANPLVSELAFHAAAEAADAWEGPGPLEAIGLLPGLTHDISSCFARSPWDDPDFVYSVVREHNPDESYADHVFPNALLAALPGLRPETVPVTMEGAQAFCRVLMGLRSEHGEIRVSDPARLLATVKGDWEGLAARWGSLTDREGRSFRRLPRLSGMLYWPARALAESVLLPLQAMDGTLDAPLSDKNPLPWPEDLAVEILTGSRSLSDLLDVALAHELACPRMTRTLPSEEESVDAGWAPLFPPTRVDGVVLSCVTTAAGLARLKPSRCLDNPHSLRTYVSMGCAHVVQAADGDARDDESLIAMFLVTWREGLWQDVRRIGPEQPSPGAEAANAALREGLRNLPPFPRPRFWPVPVADMVRDACGYDWQDDGLLERAIAAIAPYLPSGMGNREALVRAVRDHDAKRPTPFDGGRKSAFHFDGILDDLMDMA